MKNISLFSFILLSLLIAFCESVLNIRSPTQLKQFFTQKYGLDGIPYSIANFGDVHYGKTLIGEIQTPAVLQNCIYEDIPNLNKSKKIILSERNDCKFTQKSLNAQKQGGIMSIIMDSVVQNPGNIIMVDDGHGSRIHIPTILISKIDGQKILQIMLKQNVTISIYFQTKETERASLNLYLDIADRSTYVFIRKFQSYYNKIKDHVQMNINYATINCNACRQNDCFYDKAFCKKILYGWVSNAGQLFIKQQLRQQFIFKQYHDLWWKYMQRYDQHCSQTTKQNNLQGCSIDIMNDLDIDSNKILKLVDDSFLQKTNFILQANDIQRQKSQILYFPAIVVNNITYRGNLQPFQVQQLICKSLKNPPETCNFSNNQKQTPIMQWIIISVLGFTILLVFIVFCYRRIVRRQLTNNMNKQVNQLVNQYITMYQADKFRGDQELIEKQTQNN